MRPPFLPKCILVGLCASALASAFTSVPATKVRRSVMSLSRMRIKKENTAGPFRRRSWELFLSEMDRQETGPKNDCTSKNEFSRTIRVSKWFSSVGGPPSNRNRKKMMDLSISANPDERQALATRFRLTNIKALSAELVIQPALGVGSDTSGGGRGGGKVDGIDCIEAKGTVCAQVTQTCVRSNEEFDVSLEFVFDTVIRAMASSSSGSSSSEDDPLSAGEAAALDAASKLTSGGPRKKKGANKQRGVKGIRGGQSSKDLDSVGMKDLQDILMEYEVTDEIIEDESCFCTDGIVDCGEIVAQMFRSKLDPYPKKPGSDPVSYSFTF